MSEINPTDLRRKFSYDPVTGEFTIKVRAKHSNKKVGDEMKSKFGNGYIYIYVTPGRPILAHRVAWAMMTGKWPEHEIDHINGDPTDNRWENLRAASRQDQNRNTRIQKNNTSGVMGVSWDRSRGKWKAQIKVDYKNIVLGRFDTLSEAAKARKAAERKHGFHPNHGRVEA